MKIVECVPNFSEGRRKEVVDEIVNSMLSVPGVKLLDQEMDPDHNRSVITIAGSPDSVLEAAFRGAQKAVELIDLNKHRGEHPRMGAVDVIPFVPIEDVTMDDCVALAEKLGKRIAEELKVPVYLYGEAARRPERRDLAYVRKGEFEGLRESIKTDPEREPDFGPREVHPTAGAVAVGARKILVAYNVNLGTPDVSVAKKIAKRVRAKGGGLAFVKALGFELKERGISQVSMNMVDFEKTPLYSAFELVKLYADRYGVPVIGSEIVGLVPQRALVDVADFYLKLEGFKPDQIIEARLKENANPLEDYISELSMPTPTPGGGAVSAFSLAQGYALLSMVAGLTLKSKKYQDRWEYVKSVYEEAGKRIGEALSLMEEDSRAFEKFMEALKLPKETEEEKKKRNEAKEQALRWAAEVPLRTARAAEKGLYYAMVLADYGNVNAITDVGCALHQFRAAFYGARLNVLINLSALKDEEFVANARKELDSLRDAFEKKFMEIMLKVEEKI